MEKNDIPGADYLKKANLPDPDSLCSESNSLADAEGNDPAVELMHETLRNVFAEIGENHHAAAMAVINAKAGTNAKTLETFFDAESEGEDEVTDLIAVTSGAEGEIDTMNEVYESLYEFTGKLGAIATARGVKIQDLESGVLDPAPLPGCIPDSPLPCSQVTQAK